MREFANMLGPQGLGNSENTTAILWQGFADSLGDTPYIAPDIMHIWLFQEMVATGGSVAFALQAMITVLSRKAYYDQIAHFDNNQPVEVAYFIMANTPQHYWGFLAVSIVLTSILFSSRLL
jgi:hypothetical protein